MDSKGPVFFVQERAGKDGKVFRAYKLRTMVDNAEKIGLGYEIEKNDSRITRVGKYLRWGIMDGYFYTRWEKGDRLLFIIKSISSPFY